MADAGDRSSQDRRLRFLRFGLVAITGVVFALVTAVRFTTSGAQLGDALMQGLLWGVIVGVVSVVLYFGYKSVVLKA